MLRRWTAALMLVSAAAGPWNLAACAVARAAEPFPVVPRPEGPRPSHRAAWACAIAGAGLVAASFPLSDRADRRYAEYLAETDPSAVEDRYNATRRADHLASASLLAGEALVVTAVWLAFVRKPSPPRAALVVGPDRCAVSVRF